MSTLRQLAARSRARHGAPGTGGESRGQGVEVAERCAMCAEPVAATHRHLLDLGARELRCACRACAILFADPAAAGGRFRLVPDRRWYLPGFDLDDATWAGLRIPVQTAFLFRDSAAGRTALFYPSPAGAVESPLDQDLWARLEKANPVLDRLADDVEALLVNRAGDRRDHWLVPVDDCYTLVGLLRARWKGLAGGPEVWDEIAGFFTGLRRRAKTVERDHEEAPR